VRPSLVRLLLFEKIRLQIFLVGASKIWQSKMFFSVFFRASLTFSVLILVSFDHILEIVLSNIILLKFVFGDLLADIIIDVADAVGCRGLYKLSRSSHRLSIIDSILVFKVIMILVLTKGMLAFDKK
jgi:hypothetical protein